MSEIRKIIDTFTKNPLLGVCLLLFLSQILIPLLLVYLLYLVIQKITDNSTKPAKRKLKPSRPISKQLLLILKQFLMIIVIPICNYVLKKLGKEPIAKSNATSKKPKLKQYKRLDGKPSQFGVQVGCRKCGLIQPAANLKCSSCDDNLM